MPRPAFSPTQKAARKQTLTTRTAEALVRRFNDGADVGPWIYVGTEGVDGVDGLLTDDSPPFQNGWTNSFAAGSSGLRYRQTPFGIQIQGGVIGGDDGTVITVLTVAPDFFVPDVAAFADGLTLFTWSLDSDGTLTYMATL